MGTSSERVFNGSGKGYLPAGTIDNRTHILSERLKAATEFKRLKRGIDLRRCPQHGHTFCPISPVLSGVNDKSNPALLSNSASL